MKNVLVISGHPNLSESVANSVILDELASGLKNVEIRKLDQLYPTKQFDIAAEQAALLNADVIVFQFPFSWYSLPGLMKLWLEEVFLHGFSHGSKGQLGGKKLIVSFTTGAPKAAYAKDAVMKHDVEDYMCQFESTAILCGLELQAPIYTNGVSYSARQTEELIEVQRQAAREHAQRLIAAIQAA
ncbi:putative NADPH-quinone reductase [Cricetibacter osteomyelitidis]|uniref:Putative NADPH-quinone reductase n=1 Tax=Cricetibacter osteomyelitidis TaxID=1521931 RepID=A0A4R2T5G7_9PAST|nr:NAD(P)H-dependent oxidoreductase [Cricetibacter osteomyelitidis]TCP97315.1 putative NADPH-quinone reductase [Cricetibacter osteomyelitidis]